MKLNKILLKIVYALQGSKYSRANIDAVRTHVFIL